MLEDRCLLERVMKVDREWREERVQASFGILSTAAACVVGSMAVTCATAMLLVAAFQTSNTSSMHSSRAARRTPMRRVCLRYRQNSVGVILRNYEEENGYRNICLSRLIRRTPRYGRLERKE